LSVMWALIVDGVILAFIYGIGVTLLAGGV
jgi:hypothetical protein